MEHLTVISISTLPPSPQNHQSISKIASLPYQNRLSVLPQTTYLSNSLNNRIRSCQNHLPIPKAVSFLTIPRSHHQNSFQNRLSNLKTLSSLNIPSTHPSIPLQCHISDLRTSSLLGMQTTYLTNPLENQLSTIKTTSVIGSPTGHLLGLVQNQLPTFKTVSLFKILTSHVPSPLLNHLSIFKTALSFSLLAALTPFPLAAETTVPTEQVSDKINIESILISIDNFFNRYPFFVASITFVWLVAIPLTQEYLKKFKYISAFNAFQKLKDDPNAVLLDIRNKQSLTYLNPPNLKILKKSAVKVEFSEGLEDAFVKEVLRNLSDQKNTIVCVLDNFDGSSLKVAELLFKNGFKEAYAIKGGLRGKDGWQEIQENLLPPSVHVYPRKKGETSQQLDASKEKTGRRSGDNGKVPTAKWDDNRKVENGSVMPAEMAPQAHLSSERPLSPYPNYPDLKPPPSPTPSRPQK